MKRTTPIKLVLAGLVLSISCTATALGVDFDNDGTSDILWRDLATKEMRTWTMNNSGSYDAISFLPKFNTGSDNWEVVALGDVNGDDITDIIFRDVVAGYNRAWILGATGNNVSRTTIAFYPQFGGATWSIIGVGDSNKDGTEDLYFHDSTAGTLRIWEMDSSGNRETVCFFGNSIQGYEATLADVDGDGDADIFWHKPSTGVNKIWIIENCAVSTILYPPIESEPDVLPGGAGDFNNDGTDDILWVDSVSGAQYIWRMSAGAYSSTHYLPDPTAGNLYNGIGDFNGDGTDDILVYSSSTGKPKARLISNLVFQSSVGLNTFGAGGSWDILNDLDN